MNIILFDDPVIRAQLLPLTFTRPVASLRVGILTIAEKWSQHLEGAVSFSTSDYLQQKFPLQHAADNFWVNGALCPDAAVLTAIRNLKPGEGIQKNSRILAVRTHEDELPEVIAGKVLDYGSDVTLIDQPWKIFVQNGPQIRADFEMLTKGKRSASVGDAATVVYNAPNIFIEEGVTIKAGILNAEIGPIYLGKNSQVQEGAVIRGPFGLGARSIINMGGKMRGDTTIGPDCKVGGEISNCVIYGNSNKAHEGFLGNSVLGEWCNLGADTNTSNMKNNYDEVKLWSYAKNDFVKTGLMFCGLIMGDHSKAGINTMFNTGTVVGVNCNVAGAGYAPNFVPSFSWGEGVTYQLDKAFATATRVMARRSEKFSDSDRNILEHVFNITSTDRAQKNKKA